MSQTQAPRRERVERSLKRLGHKLEKRGRGYQIRDGSGTIVSGKDAIALDAVEGWIAEYVKPKKTGKVLVGYRLVRRAVPNSGGKRYTLRSTPIYGETQTQMVPIKVHPTEAELAQQNRMARAQRLIDEVEREKAERRETKAKRKPFGKQQR